MADTSPQDQTTLNQLKAAMQDPRVRNSSPNQLIDNLAAVLGLDLDPVSQEQSEAIRNEYFQAIRLEGERWTSMPGLNNYVQIHPFKLKQIPKDTEFVADVLIDKSDIEAEYFNRYVRNMSIRGSNIVFTSVTPIPTDIVIGLKCINSKTKETVRVPDSCFKKSPS